jgi:23S rRNA pseudouridine2605 synthase
MGDSTERPKRSYSSRPNGPTDRPSRGGEGRYSERDNQPDGPSEGRRFSKPRPSQANANQSAKPVRPVKLDEPIRLNKFLAHCGVAARRQSAEYVKKGLVTVNGEMEPNPSYPVQPGDEVRFKGQVVRLEARKVYILMNKPKDIITTASDEKGRRTVMDLIGTKVEERIFPVGRLDRNTSGLLLLTNDGDLAEKLAHPSHNVQKVYHVTLDKPFHKQDFEKVQKGLKLEDGLAEVDSLHYIDGKKDELEIGLHIGRNRIVRRIFEHLGYEVIKLDRTYYAGLTKKDIGRGHFRHLSDQEVIMLKHFK